MFPRGLLPIRASVSQSAQWIYAQRMRISGIDTTEARGDRVWPVGRSLKYQLFLPRADTDVFLHHLCSLKQIQNKSPSYLSFLFYQSLSPVACSDMELLRW